MKALVHRPWGRVAHAVAAGLLGVSGAAWAHGGVLLEDDVCVMKIGFFKAHFTVYQPDSRGSREFCEDLPDAGRTLFVLEYLHDGLRQLPVDLRIIRDVEAWGRYARWEDVQSLGDLEPVTEFYQPPTRHRGGAMTVEHDFDSGRYVGIVTARHQGRVYRAVFPFQVGWIGPGTWVWLIPVAAAFLLYVLASNRGWLRRRAPRGSEA